MQLVYAFPEPLPLPKARGIQTVNTVRALAEGGIALTLAYVPVEGADPFRHYGLEPPAGVRLLPLSRALPWPLARLHSNRMFAARLARAVRAEPAMANAIMVRHIKLAALLLDALPDVPLLYEAHEVFADTAPPARRARLAELESRVLRDAAAVVAITGSLAQALRTAYRLTREIPVVPSGVNFPEQAPAKDWANPAAHVLYCGSLYDWKGVQDLVQAAALLEGFTVTLVGGTREEVERLRREAPESGARLVLRGSLPHPQALAEIGRACIAVLPNRPDSVSRFTSPIKLFEYMAAGCAVVASDIPALREVLSQEDATWVPPADPRALAAAIRALAADPQRARAMGGGLREKARGYTWRSRAEKLVAALPRQGSARA